MRYVIDPKDSADFIEIAKQHGWDVVEQKATEAKSEAARTLTVTEAARRCGVHIDTMRRWVDTNKVSSFRTPGGHRRIPEDALPQAH